jgi:GT2 family glycosyltransferase
MALARTRRRIRLLRKGLATLTAIYRRDGNIRHIVGDVWFVATREGLIGVHQWLIRSAPADIVAAAATEAAVTAEAAPPQNDAQPARDPQPGKEQLYREWLGRFDPLQERDLQAARRHLATLDLPDLLILAVVTSKDLPAIGRMVASWQASIHRGWHAAIAVSSDVSVAEIVAIRAAASVDARISVVTTPGEIETIRRRFEFALLCFGSTLLNSLSAYMFLEAADRTGAEIIYSDHDRMDGTGQRLAPAFKSQFSPEYLARYNYIGDCLLIARSVSFTIEETEALLRLTLTQYDRFVARLVLDRLVEHLPFTLFHVLDEQPRAPHDLPAFANTGPSVAIIIPIRDGLDYLRPCIDSILEKTSYDLGQVDIIVVDNNSVEPETLEYLEDLAARPNFAVLKYPGPFNFAEINNLGAQSTTRDVLVFLNNDMTVYDPAWLSKLVAYANLPGVGMVGAKLLFPDGTIQHAGCVAGGSMGTVQHLLTRALPADVAAIDHTREISLVTGACVAVRRDVFHQVGGFDPILRITWNDVKTCLECLSAGLRNIYIADPLLTHDESKTRGQDNTRERYIRYFSEADYTRRRFRDYFYDDPSYNPNLSLENAGDLAEPPRVRRPWFRPANQPPRILLLSTVYRMGFGVPVVIQQHAMKLVQLGYDVIIGGPLQENEISFPGCERVVLGSVKEAAVYAFTTGVALIVSHTPPFFELPVLIGAHIPVLAYDYGEPAAEFFQEPVRSFLFNVGYQKRGAAALTTTIATISQSVKDETLNKDALVVGLANSHLPAWSEALRPDRDRFRHERGWNDSFVVLTVCRFHENERAYKGLDKIAEILREYPYLYPEHAKPLIWVLAGRGTPDDVAQAEQLGFTVFPNVSDEVLADMYKAADAYMGFSKWEGYNLGIGQALAMGLPTIGSDIPAHREFGITTTNSTLIVCKWLANEVTLRTAATPRRTATVYEWERSTTEFVKVVEGMLQRSAAQKPRSGASGHIWYNLAASSPQGRPIPASAEPGQ